MIDYYGVALSDNIARTSEGYVVCKDVVIGRTGSQDYRVSQLSKAQLADLGLADRWRPDDIVPVYRDADEVFSPATIASFEGKAVTDDHPTRFVTAQSHSEHACGHAQNVRRGDIPLSSGDMPLIADLMITDPELGDDILNRRKRELSCGYGYMLAYDGSRLSQTQITGNHVAVVSKGRAGAEARINDSAIPRKEHSMKKVKDYLIGLGLTAMAKDNADPEQIAAAARAVANDEDDKPEEKSEEKPKAEANDALDEIKTSIKSLSERMDAYDAALVQAKDAKDDEEAQEAEAEDEKDDEEDEDDKEGKAEDAFIQPGDSDLISVLRPLVARSKDAAIKKAFNGLIAKANDSKRGNTPVGAYGTVNSAARKPASALDSADRQSAYHQKLNEKAQAAFYGGSKDVK